MPFSMASQSASALAGKMVPSYSVKFKGETPGMYAVTAFSSTQGRRIESESAYFSVKPYSPESRPRPPDVETVKAITANSNGTFFKSADDLNRALISLQPKQLKQEVSKYKTFWQSWIILSMLILSIVLEWIIRKIRNLT